MALRDTKTRSLVWEDDPPAESRFRRAQPSVPLSGRSLPGMPIEVEDPDDDGSTQRRPRRFSDEPVTPWWRPAGKTGRILVAVGGLAVFSAITVAAIALRNFLEHDARFRVAGTGNIQATGLSEVTRSEMLPVFGEDVGRNIFFVPLAERRRQLEQIPWIERATVMRLLPDQIRVSITERKPVAFVRRGQQIGLVDSNGVLLNMPSAIMAQHHYSFPVITGIDSRDPVAARKNRIATFERMIEELDANGQHLSDQISEIDLTDPEDARVLMPEQGTDILAHFGGDHFLERYQRYKAHIAEWRQQYPKLVEVDLRYEQQVVLQMTPGANTVPASLTENSGSSQAASSPKPPPDGVSEKPSVPKANTRKHAQSAKPAKQHSSTASKSKSTKTKPSPKKHPDVNHTAYDLTEQNPATVTIPTAAAQSGQ